MQELLRAVIHGKPWIDSFNRVEYQKTFERYKVVHEENFKKALSEKSVKELAEDLILEIENAWTKEHFWNRKSEMVDTKTMIVLYLSPMLVGSDSAACNEFAKVLAETWNSKYPQNTYTAADYDTIASGFTNTIMGIDMSRR